MSTNGDAKESGRGFDVAKWILVAILLVVAIVGNRYFQYHNLTLRVMAIFVIAILASGVILCTEKGKAALIFARESRIEIRKVIWPTHQETLQTTLIIIAFTAVMALILWGLDGILVCLVSFITRLRL